MRNETPQQMYWRAQATRSHKECNEARVELMNAELTLFNTGVLDVARRDAAYARITIADAAHKYNCEKWDTADWEAR